jgi:hypothetical protein
MLHAIVCDGLRVYFFALEGVYNLCNETVQKLINHLSKLIFRLNIIGEIPKKKFLDQVSRIESRPPLALYT